MAWQYKPDIVWLAFFTGNDVQNNHRVLEYDPMRPYFVLEGDKVVLDTSYLRSLQYRARQTWIAQLLYSLINHSRVLQVVNQAKNVTNGYLVERHKHADALARNETDVEAGLDDNVFREPKTHEWKEAWEITERLLVMMRDEVRERGAKFLVVTLSTSIQVHPDPEKQKRFMEQLRLKDLFYPDLRVKVLGDRAGAIVNRCVNSLRRLSSPATSSSRQPHL